MYYYSIFIGEKDTSICFISHMAYMNTFFFHSHWYERDIPNCPKHATDVPWLSQDLVNVCAGGGGGGVIPCTVSARFGL